MTGARAIPTKNPKAPLPPRASQVDAFEQSNVHPSQGQREELVPESVEPAQTIRRVDTLDDMRRGVASGRSQPPPVPNSRPGGAGPSSRPSHHHSTSGSEDAETAAVLPKDFSKALAQLQNAQQQRGGGAPAPPAPKSNPGNANTRAIFGSNPVPETVRMESPAGSPSPRRLASVPPSSAKLSDDLPSARDLAKNLQRPITITPAAPDPSLQPGQQTQVHHQPSLLQSIVNAPIAPGPSSSTAPLGTANVSSLQLKPGTGTPLAPMRAPNPMAIVGGGGGLRINSPDRPMSPLGVSSPKVSSVAPGPMRPPTGSKSFPPPAGGPPVQYERAFRQWSSPAIIQNGGGGGGGGEDTNGAPAVDPGGGAGGPGVSFQVYTPKDIGAGRGPMRSLPIIDAQTTKKPALGVRIAMAAVGGVIVLLTALAVIAVSTEDPKKPTPTNSSAKPTGSAPPRTNGVGSGSQAEPPPAPPPPPTAMVIGDPDDAVPSSPSSTAPSAKPTPRIKPTGGGGGGATATPSNLKQIAPPPNPYGNK